MRPMCSNRPKAPSGWRFHFFGAAFGRVSLGDTLRPRMAASVSPAECFAGVRSWGLRGRAGPGENLFSPVRLHQHAVDVINGSDSLLTAHHLNQGAKGEVFGPPQNPF